MRLSLLAIVAMLLAAPAWAGTISYDISSYGGRHAIVILSGDVGANVTANLSADGLSIRVTASGAAFEPGPKGVAGALVSEVKQVRRGASSDLVLNLASASDLSVTPSVSNIKLFIKARKDNSGASTPRNGEAVGQTGNAPKKLKPIPLQFIATRDLTALSANSPQLIAVALPEREHIGSNNSLAVHLRDIAYAIDVAWAWISGAQLTYAAASSESCTPQQTPQEVSELENLVRDLTQELIELRRQKSIGSKP
ncbi:MAG: hypothetical protein K1X79_03865 [Oligoflexia bacterium]|nr:hypothetical protein [Oligoflexia bacterium]